MPPAHTFRICFAWMCYLCYHANRSFLIYTVWKIKIVRSLHTDTFSLWNMISIIINKIYIFLTNLWSILKTAILHSMKITFWKQLNKSCLMCSFKMIYDWYVDTSHDFLSTKSINQKYIIIPIQNHDFWNG